MTKFVVNRKTALLSHTLKITSIATSDFSFLGGEFSKFLDPKNVISTHTKDLCEKKDPNFQFLPNSYKKFQQVAKI